MCPKRQSPILVLATVVTIGLWVVPPSAAQGPTNPAALAVLDQILNLGKANPGRGAVIGIEIAENGARFVPDETPVLTDPPYPAELAGLPAYGGEFVTEGYLYPAGTLLNDDIRGVHADGSPQFPDKVIGRWTCRGWHVGEGAATIAGPWVVTHQIFDFGPDIGEFMIMTDGFESPVGVPLKRAITGGTGPFAGARGEQVQTFGGFPNAGLGIWVYTELHVQFR